MYANADLSGDEEEGIGDNPRKLRVDSDYFLIGVDNHAYTCMNKIFNHFIVSPGPINNRSIEGYGGTVKVGGEFSFRSVNKTYTYKPTYIRKKIPDYTRK